MRPAPSTRSRSASCRGPRFRLPALRVQRGHRRPRRGHLHERPGRAALLGRLAGGRLRAPAQRGERRLSGRAAGACSERVRGHEVNLVDVFNGLLIAIPALTALAALSLLARSRRVAAGWPPALTGLPYLGASFLAQSGFKETAMAMFVRGAWRSCSTWLPTRGRGPRAAAGAGGDRRDRPPRGGIGLHLLDPRRRLVRDRGAGLGDPHRGLRDRARSTSRASGRPWASTACS